LDWSESVFRYPTGRSKGERYNRRHQPATAKFLEIADDSFWRRITLVAPNQAGKSLSLVQFLCHCLFNIQEDLIFGVPDIEKMWQTKWKKDLLPVIQASPELRKLLPDEGRGTKGGVPSIVLFQNGQSFQVMGAKAGSTQRSGSTARIVLVTELKDWGETDNDEEGTKMDQLASRTLSYQGDELLFAESTITDTKNIAWTEYLKGTQSMPHFECPGCGEFISPDRCDLIGWQDARNQLEARDKARFSCPCCGYVFEEAERKRLLQDMVVLHKGQTVDNGKIIGDPPPTTHFSYRFTAATNMFSDAGAIGQDEWEIKHEKDLARRATKNRWVSQAIFATPSDDSEFEIDPLDGNVLLQRVRSPQMGVVKAGSQYLCAGVDVRKTQVHWVVIAYGAATGPQVVQWGVERVLQDIPFESALPIVGKALQEKFREGFHVDGSTQKMSVSLTLMDSGWQKDAVRKICNQDVFWMSVMGRGSGYLKGEKYIAPSKLSKSVLFIGDRMHLEYIDGHWKCQLDANRWKSKLHEALKLPPDDGYALTFPASPDAILREYVNHLLSEKEVLQQKSGESVVIFEEVGGPNHWLDASYYAWAAKTVHEFMMELHQEEEIVEEPPKKYGNGPLFG
jgi:phage terminase large subunit GpA-like protein